MYNLRNILNLSKENELIIKCCKTFHTSFVCHDQAKVNQDKLIDSPLFMTTTPGRIRGKKRQSEPEKPVDEGPLLIKCKNTNKNYYNGTKYSDISQIRLASSGWRAKSCPSDFFSILPIHEHPAFSQYGLEKLPNTFEEIGVNEVITKQLKEMQVERPTVIQAKAIEKIYLGKNVFMASENGGGKTLAYLIPIVANLLELKKVCPTRTGTPRSVIIMPSRELVLQTTEICSNLCSDLGILCKGPVQLDEMNKETTRIDILVSTPSMLTKLGRYLDFDELQHVVVDNAEILFNRDLYDALQKVFSINSLSFRGRSSEEMVQGCIQIIFSSSLLSESRVLECERLAPMDSLEKIQTGYVNRVLTSVEQEFFRMNKCEKFTELLKMAKRNLAQKIPTLIFSNTKNTCSSITSFLKECRIDCIEMSNAILSRQRIKKYKIFQSEPLYIISSTDILSNGLNFPGLTHVINYDFPEEIITYLQRCGRLWRLNANKNCKITHFVSSENSAALVQEIELAVRVHRELNINLKSRNIKPE